MHEQSHDRSCLKSSRNGFLSDRLSRYGHSVWAFHRLKDALIFFMTGGNKFDCTMKSRDMMSDFTHCI